jgi:penicillin-binding protein 1A
VRVEKLLDDAARTTGEPAKPTKPVSSTSAGFTDSFASAVPESPVASPTPRKN